VRLDKFLKVSRLIKQRQRAKELCDAQSVKLNDRMAKASSAVEAGDQIEMISRDLLIRAEIIKIPTGNVSKKESIELVRIVERVMLNG